MWPDAGLSGRDPRFCPVACQSSRNKHTAFKVVKKDTERSADMVGDDAIEFEGLYSGWMHCCCAGFSETNFDTATKSPTLLMSKPILCRAHSCCAGMADRLCKEISSLRAK